MTLSTHGGPADSGRKLRRASDAEPKDDWTCPSCRHVNRGYTTRCLTAGCNARRPTGHRLRMAQVDATPFLPELNKPTKGT